MLSGKYKSLLEQCIATGQQEAVPVAVFERRLADFDFVDAQPDGRNATVPAEFVHRPVAAVHGDREQAVVVLAMRHGADVVHVQDVDAIEAEYNIDPRRIHLIGHSNGGFMCHRMACEAPDMFASVVSLTLSLIHI